MVICAVIGVTQCQGAEPSTPPVVKLEGKHYSPQQQVPPPSERKKVMDHLKELEDEMNGLKATLTKPPEP